MDQICQKVLLVLTHLGFETYTSSTLLFFHFSRQSVYLDSFLHEEDS